MSHTSAQSDIANETAAKSLSMDENIDYGGSYIGCNKSLVKVSHSRMLLLVLFVLLIALLFGTVCVCVAFALEISNLKSEIASLQTASSSSSLQSLNASMSYATFEEKIQHLDTSVASCKQDFSALNDMVQQLNSTTQFLLNAQYTLNQRLNVSYLQLRQSSNILDEKIQILNNSADFSLLDNRTQELRRETKMLIDTIFSFHTVTSCAALPPSAPSGYYSVISPNDSTVRVYCDMTRSCGGVTGGWARVAELDMTNSSHQCPSGLTQRIDSNKRTCTLPFYPGCSSVTFSSAAWEYSKVCGRIKAYQVGSTDSFGGHSSDQTIDSFYVDGISVTHGIPRQHIWTFASALDEVSSIPGSNCLCTNVSSASSAVPPPAYVGGDYFCDTGSEGHYVGDRFYGDDPLWDGAGCGPLNTCCSFNNPPWFYKQLPQPSTDDIEVRVCRSQNFENIATEVIEIYIQ